MSNKILVVGCVGCGKSTYAKKLSKKLGIPVYGIDEIVHDDLLGVRRSLDEQKELIKKIALLQDSKDETQKDSKKKLVLIEDIGKNY